jgi:hypothetical protein
MIKSLTLTTLFQWVSCKSPRFAAYRNQCVTTPIPLSNILPAVVIALISSAYAEEDGLMLSICLGAAFVMLAIDLAMAWHIISSVSLP